MRVLILFLFINISFTTAQNLVLNPNFEDYTSCPSSHSQFSNNITHWSLPNKGTSDYYNLCSNKFNYVNPHGIQHFKKGKGYAGIVTFYQNKYNTLPDYREYIQGELNSTLKKGETYTIKLAISLADKSNTALNEIELLFTEKQLNSNSEKNIDLNALKKKSIQTNLVTFRNDEFFFDKTEWMILKGTYTAKGFEKFITIGNLKPDSDTEKVQVSKPYLPIESYYYIDHIEITEDKIITFQPKKRYTFKNVLFNFDKAELLDISAKELNKLAQYLEVNKTLFIEIYGHTDNVGLETRNNKLSKLRAKAVSDYLINSGLDKNRIKWFGFGSKYPVTKNDSEENRVKNRRVEFKLFTN